MISLKASCEKNLFFRLPNRIVGQHFDYSTKARSITNSDLIPWRDSLKPQSTSIAQISFSMLGLPQTINLSLEVVGSGNPMSVNNLRPIHHKISQYWMKILILLFGLKIILKGNISRKARAFVSNHISFLDIIVLNSLIPSNFIAKSEIKSWPVIGHLAGKTGTIFINRGDVGDNDNVINLMKNYIT